MHLAQDRLKSESRGSVVWVTRKLHDLVEIERLPCLRIARIYMRVKTNLLVCPCSRPQALDVANSAIPPDLMRFVLGVEVCEFPEDPAKGVPLFVCEGWYRI